MCLEVEVLRAFFEFFETFFRQFADALARYLLYFLRYDFLSEFFQMVGAVAEEVFLEGEYRVRLADVAYLARFRKRHEAVAGASLTVAGGAVARDVAVFAEPCEDFVGRAVVGDFELRGVGAGL